MSGVLIALIVAAVIAIVAVIVVLVLDAPFLKSKIDGKRLISGCTPENVFRISG